MNLTILGEHPLKCDEKGKLVSRIGTLFVANKVLVTLPRMTHAMQRLYYQEQINLKRTKQGDSPISELDMMEVWENAVDLIMDDQAVLIRPDSSRMDLAFLADELLQTIISKPSIRFLHARCVAVQQAIRARGEYWRISPRPQEDTEIIASIERSKIAIAGLPIYYYSPSTGTRYLTLQEFCKLGTLSFEQLRQHLTEIQSYSAKRNRLHNHEVSFFGANASFNSTSFQPYDFTTADAAQLRSWHVELIQNFEAAVDASLRRDDVKNAIWRNRLFACLTDERNETLSEVLVSGLTEEFFRQIQWLPGGNIQNGGEWVFDSIFDEFKDRPQDEVLKRIVEIRVKGFIFNYIREFAQLEYINIGRLLPGLRNRHEKGTHQAYIVEVKSLASEKPDLRIIRMQRWGIKEHLAEHHDLLRAIMEAQDYTEYTLDRRLGCWELGMPVPSRLVTRMIPEEYVWQGTKGVSRIWATYYERDFIDGLATDKIPQDRMKEPAYALSIAKLLGSAAASNMVVGRVNSAGSVVFDNGDEIVLMDKSGRPNQILAADHAGTFSDYLSPLEKFAEDYAEPVLKRASGVFDPAAFARAYLDAMEQRLLQMQKDYLRAPHIFDKLFQHSKQGPETFSHRWSRVLERMKSTDAHQLVRTIRAVIAAKIPL
jgi:hypothetical protein